MALYKFCIIIIIIISHHSASYAGCLTNRGPQKCWQDHWKGGKFWDNARTTRRLTPICSAAHWIFTNKWCTIISGFKTCSM